MNSANDGTSEESNRAIQTLLLFLSPSLTRIGPAKSTAVYINGGASLTRNEGSGGD